MSCNRLRGTVKWFNNPVGIGFITAPDGGDVFVHYSMIEMDGFKTLREGDAVEFEIVPGTRGPMASRVTVLAGAPVKELPRIRGVVRWFKDSEGYGSIQREGASDVFVHYSGIIMNGHKSLNEGDVVEFSLVEGVNEPTAVRVIRLSEGSSAKARRPSEIPARHQREIPGSAWEVLGVEPGASPREISRAFHHAAHMYHPDKVAGLAPEFRELAERRMKQINAAYSELRRKAS